MTLQMDGIPSFSGSKPSSKGFTICYRGAAIVAGILSSVAIKAGLGAGVFQVPAVEQARIILALLKEEVTKQERLIDEDPVNMNLVAFLMPRGRTSLHT